MNLATVTLVAANEPTLEESWYWRARAPAPTPVMREAALEDLRTSLAYIRASRPASRSCRPLAPHPERARMGWKPASIRLIAGCPLGAPAACCVIHSLGTPTSHDE